MSGFKSFISKFLLAIVLVAAAPASVLADCRQDIDTVEATIERPDDNGLDDQVTVENIRELVGKAYEAQRKGDEAECQNLIDQAKEMANVE